MSENPILNDQIIRHALSVIKPDGELTEVRLLGGRSGKETYSGYFTSIDTMIQRLYELPDMESFNAYFVLNHIKDACYDRSQHDVFLKNPKVSTSDGDIDGYEYLFVDLDPKRPSGTSSSDEELAKAKEVGNKVFSFLRGKGFETPIMAMSGNGVHLLYPIRLENTEENRKLIQDCLKVLDMLFSTDEIEVDQKNYNPARVCKLYGTMSHKGADSKKRPHRMSTILQYDDDPKVTDIAYLKALTKMLPKEQKPQAYNNYAPREFDIESWMNKYGIQYRVSSFSEGTKYLLDECPFDSNHRGKDAAIFRNRNGAIGFYCFHASCSDKHWQDVRRLYEPTAYENRQQQYHDRIYGDYNAPKMKQMQDDPFPEETLQEEQGKPVLLSAMDIYSMEKPVETFVKSGINVIDKKMRGLKKGNVSVMSGSNGSGKSTIFSSLALDAIDAGYHVAVFSGELSSANFMNWMNLQAAGKGFTRQTLNENFYSVDHDDQKKIAEWMEGKFYLYNNTYGNDYKKVINVIESKIMSYGLDLIMLDNLMAFDVSELSKDTYQAQSIFVKDLKRIATKYNVHIIFVAHPRKMTTFLRKTDISGTADLTNAVDSCFIVHRVNEDFKRLSKEMFKWKEDNEIYEATNVIEIAKDRDGGIQDEFIPLWYEPESKRLKNHPAESKVYGWHDGFLPVTDEDIVFD